MSTADWLIVIFFAGVLLGCQLIDRRFSRRD